MHRLVQDEKQSVRRRPSSPSFGYGSSLQSTSTPSATATTKVRWLEEWWRMPPPLRCRAPVATGSRAARITSRVHFSPKISFSKRCSQICSGLGYLHSWLTIMLPLIFDRILFILASNFSRVIVISWKMIYQQCFTRTRPHSKATKRRIRHHKEPTN